MKLIRYADAIRSATAEKYDIDNIPRTPKLIQNLYKTIEKINFLNETVLGHIDIRVNSGYRCEDLNTKVGGSTTSVHRFGLALDIEPECGNRQALEIIAEFNLEYVKKEGTHFFDQLILEYFVDDENQKSDGWIHIGFRSGKNLSVNRGVLMFIGCDVDINDNLLTKYKDKNLFKSKKSKVT